MNTKRAFVGLMGIETMLAFGNTFAASFNIVYLYTQLDMPLWSLPTYLGLGFFIAIFASLWMSWRSRFDLRNAMLFGLACLCVEYSLFLFVNDGYVLAIAVGLAFGLHYPFFWVPFNALMTQLTEKNDRGVKYGVSFFIWPLATFVAPFLGGLVIGYANYQLLFGLGIAMIVATAAVVLAYRKYIPSGQEMKIQLKGIGRRNTVAVLGEGAFEGVFWVDITLVALMFSQDEIELGTLFAVFGLSAGIMGIILGKVSDKIQNRVFFLRVSALTSIPCVILVYFADSLTAYGFANGLLEFAAFMFPMFMFAILTDRLETRKNDSAVTREFLLDLGRVSTIGLLMVMLYVGFTPQECFLLCIPFLLIGTLAKEDKKGPAPVTIGGTHPDPLH